MRTLFTVLLGVFFLVGCNSVQKPTATVQSAQLGQVTPEGMTLNLGLLVSNPNAMAIPLTKTGYKLELAGVKVLDGSADPKTNIPANGSAPVTLPISIKWQDMLKARDALIQTGGDVPYTLSGDLNFNTGLPLIGDQTIPLSHTGRLPLRQALSDPQVLMKSPVARELAQAILGGFMR